MALASRLEDWVRIISPRQDSVCSDAAGRILRRLNNAPIEKLKALEILMDGLRSARAGNVEPALSAIEALETLGRPKMLQSYRRLLAGVCKLNENKAEGAGLPDLSCMNLESSAFEDDASSQKRQRIVPDAAVHGPPGQPVRQFPFEGVAFGGVPLDRHLFGTPPISMGPTPIAMAYPTTACDAMAHPAAPCLPSLPYPATSDPAMLMKVSDIEKQLERDDMQILSGGLVPAIDDEATVRPGEHYCALPVSSMPLSPYVTDFSLASRGDSPQLAMTRFESEPGNCSNDIEIPNVVGQVLGEIQGPGESIV